MPAKSATKKPDEKAKPPPEDAPAEPTDHQQGEAADAARAGAAEPEPEVRPEEFSAGAAEPVTRSLFPPEVVEELRKPLDPHRVRSRQGRGTSKLEYLAGHDVKRRASEIFGFGNWGHTIVEQKEIGAVEVEGRDNKKGWHVAYRCVVRVWVRAFDSTGLDRMFETEGSGYGDGVEYTPAARVTACELALKESETDALKRAFTDLGDQFGLILYAKGDEKQRIARDRSAADTDRAVVRQEEAGRMETPKTWPEMHERFAQVLGGTDNDRADAGWWMNEAITSKFGQRLQDLPEATQREAWALIGPVVLTELEPQGGLDLDPDVRAKVVAAFAARNGGVKLDGPPWRIAPGEDDRPSREDWETARDASAASAAAEAGDEDLALDAAGAEAAQDADDANAEKARAAAGEGY